MRITNDDLDRLVRVINTYCGYEVEPHSQRDGKFQQNPNTFVLDYAYGAVALDQNMPLDKDGESHGVRCVLDRGPKRDLYGRLQAFHRGLVNEVVEG